MFKTSFSFLTFVKFIEATALALFLSVSSYAASDIAQSSTDDGTHSFQSPKFLKGFSEIVDNYDVYFFDLWGVMHGGKKVFPKALEVLNRLKESGKHVYFISNTSQGREASIKKLKTLGIESDLYKDVLTAGQHCFDSLNERKGYTQRLGKKYYFIGASHNFELFSKLKDYEKVDQLDDADFILLAGTYAAGKSGKEVDRFKTFLQRAITLGLPMVCANPDKVQIFDGKKVECSGKVAEDYEAMGGIVHYHGKPNVDIYLCLMEKICLEHSTSPARTLMIGDSLHTDIQGANNALIHSIFILSGIHELTAPPQSSLYEEHHALPTYVMTNVSW